MRVVQRADGRGSLKWTQRLINDFPDLLDSEIRRAVSIGPEPLIEWSSPRANDEFAEYRDQDFLRVIDASLTRRSLSSFWPARGPQWDALGRTSSGAVLLVEAKAHVNELLSGCSAKSERSLRMIREALDDTKGHYGVSDSADWLSAYYQYTNRLAHLYLLRELNAVNAHLIHVCFMNDAEMGGPASPSEWESAFAEAHQVLGLGDRPIEGLHHVFIDVGRLQRS